MSLRASVQCITHGSFVGGHRHPDLSVPAAIEVAHAEVATGKYVQCTITVCDPEHRPGDTFAVTHVHEGEECSFSWSVWRHGVFVGRVTGDLAEALACEVAA